MDKIQAKSLFTKYTNNQSSDEENDLLETFLDSYQDKTSEDFEESTVQNSKEKIWNNIISTIEPKPIEKKLNFFSFYTLYAVAASIVLLFSISFYFTNYTGQKTNTTTTIAAQKVILTGSDKALLTLENGETVSLEKGKNYTGQNANSNGETLVYQNDNSETDTTIKYNYLTIPRGGQFFVQLADGTKVWLNSESKLKFPIAFKEGQSRNIELVYGEAYFDVSSSKNHQGANFNVATKGQKIEVLGTEFNVKAYQDEQTIATTLVEGKIKYQFKDNTEFVKPNEQIILNLENEKITSQMVNVHNETAWKDGIFSFKGKNLKEIMKVLSRWYDVEVVFENKNIENLTFKGVLGKDQSIEEILSSIKSASLINSYNIKDKTIYLK